MELKNYQATTLETLDKFLRSVCSDGVSGAFDLHADPDGKTGLVPSYRPLRDKDNIEVAALTNVPYVAIRIPTGGGKTLMGARIGHGYFQCFCQCNSYS